MQTNMFVHVYILPHHQSFPHSPSTHTLPLQLHRMPPKSKPNTCSGTAQTLPDSHKHQGSNADKPKTKRTQHKTIEANDNKNKSGDEQEAADGVEDKDDPPELRGGRRGHAMKKGPPRRYVGHDHCRLCLVLQKLSWLGHVTTELDISEDQLGLSSAPGSRHAGPAQMSATG